MLKVAMPAGKYGEALQRCMEDVVENMRGDLSAHAEGVRMYPEDISECTVWVEQLWDQIHDLRNAASFSLSNLVDLGESYDLSPEDPLMVVTKNALLLEFVDIEIGLNKRNPISIVLGYILFNPNFPDGGPRVYH